MHNRRIEYADAFYKFRIVYNVEECSIHAHGNDIDDSQLDVPYGQFIRNQTAMRIATLVPSTPSISVSSNMGSAPIEKVEDLLCNLAYFFDRAAFCVFLRTAKVERRSKCTALSYLSNWKSELAGSTRLNINWLKLFIRLRGWQAFPPVTKIKIILQNAISLAFSPTLKYFRQKLIKSNGYWTIARKEHFQD